MFRKILNKETIIYIVFGAATTVVNYIVFFAFYHTVFRDNSLAANGVAFVAAVIFAFVVNKMFVFESKSWSFDALKREVPSFLGTRLGTFLIEETGLFLSENVLLLGGVTAFSVMGYSFDWIVIVKVLLSVVVVVLNYVFCKLFVFKK